jgi:hypothetical protein
MAARNKNDSRSNIDGWTEYKRLVLSELERLDEAVEKLKDHCVKVQSYIQDEIAKVRESLLVQINEIDKNHPSHKWGFWAAVIGIVGSVITSIISLIVTLFS